MKKRVFLEQLETIKEIQNVLFIGNPKEKFDFNCKTYISTNSLTSRLKFSASQLMSYFESNFIKLSIIYISEELPDLEYILDYILKDDGLLIFDNCPVIANIEDKMELVYKDDANFFVYQKKHLQNNALIYTDLEKRVKFSLLKPKNKKKSYNVGIGVLTYQHEKYIVDCLNGIFRQKGNFKAKVVIVDDSSNDETANIINCYLEEHNIPKNFEVEVIINEKNKGAVFGIETMLEKFKNTDYFTFCEGDDFWNTDKRIEKFISYMQENPYVSVSFNSFYIYEHETNRIWKNPIYTMLNKNYYSTQQLILGNYFIGNLGCCFYDSFYLKYFDKKLFSLPLYDFFFNTYYSTFGLIGYLDEYLSTYRMHHNSMWSSLKENTKNENLINYMYQYNKYFNYIYDYEYSSFINSLFYDKKINSFSNFNLLIVDNIFPNPLSPFSYEEISSYLRNIPKSQALVTYLSSGALNGDSLREGTIEYKRKNSDVANSVSYYTREKALSLNSKLMYFIFKSTTMYYFDLLKEKKCDFIFELYPGGGFFFDDPTCDADLKKIMSLKGFKKVIVTQKPIKDYLLKKRLCKKSQIELIFGVVMNNKDNDYRKKAFYGENKKNLDIVFMAHRYNDMGKDKGYDLFVATAKKLSAKYQNIMFHVVGNYDEKIIDVSKIKDRIKFYGPLKKSEFDEFYSDKDIIVSPNRPNILFKGAFDGFPTASCTEAGLRETVMLCSDELNMSIGYYNDFEDVVLIKNEVNDIAKKIERLYKNPRELKRIALNTRKHILELYSFEKQMKPRIDVIRKVLNIKGDHYEK